MSIHYFQDGVVYASDIFDKTEKYLTTYINSKYDVIELPTPETLKIFLETGKYEEPQPLNPSTEKPSPSPSPVPSPTVKPNNPTAQPTIKPTLEPTSNGNVSKSSTVKLSKVKNTSSSVKLINSSGKTVKTVKFKKKTGILNYKGKKIKKVKAAYFTKKGSILYVTKNKKAYYLNGKKSKLIKKNVSSVKVNSKKFAISLKLKGGKIFKLTK